MLAGRSADRIRVAAAPMPAKVTFASARPPELRADATLPILLDRMPGRCAFRKRFKGRRVAIKMHLGGGVGYSTIHPLLVARVR